jgi:hypothetical protein
MFALYDQLIIDALIIWPILFWVYIFWVVFSDKHEKYPRKIQNERQIVQNLLAKSHKQKGAGYSVSDCKEGKFAS